MTQQYKKICNACKNTRNDLLEKVGILSIDAARANIKEIEKQEGLRSAYISSILQEFKVDRINIVIAREEIERCDDCNYKIPYKSKDLGI